MKAKLGMVAAVLAAGRIFAADVVYVNDFSTRTMAGDGSQWVTVRYDAGEYLYRNYYSTADVNTDYIRNCLIYDGHRCTDGAALSGVDIRHDPDLAVFSEGIVAHPPDLLNSNILDDLCKADSRIYFSFYFYHCSFPYNLHEKTTCPIRDKWCVSILICLLRISFHITVCPIWARQGTAELICEAPQR